MALEKANHHVEMVGHQDVPIELPPALGLEVSKGIQDDSRRPPAGFGPGIEGGDPARRGLGDGIGMPRGRVAAFSKVPGMGLPVRGRGVEGQGRTPGLLLGLIN